MSDEDDIFSLEEAAADALPAEYLDSDRWRWLLAVREVAALLREEPTMPLRPREADVVCTDIDSGVAFPVWHCAFRKCTACSVDDAENIPHEQGLWRHIAGNPEHRNSLWQIARAHALLEKHLETDTVLFTLYAAAVAERERESMPQVGVSRDRRCLQHVGEVFHEEAIGVLMCFVCAGKHLRCSGCDLFGKSVGSD